MLAYLHTFIDAVPAVHPKYNISIILSSGGHMAAKCLRIILHHKKKFWNLLLACCFTDLQLGQAVHAADMGIVHRLRALLSSSRHPNSYVWMNVQDQMLLWWLSVLSMMLIPKSLGLRYLHVWASLGVMIIPPEVFENSTWISLSTPLKRRRTCPWKACGASADKAGW